MSSDPSPRVSVIVLTYNSRADIEACLRSVVAQDYAACEILVVDNVSTDGTLDLVRQSFDDVRTFSSPFNVGYGAGNNIAARAATGEILVFLNPDTIAEPAWLTNIVKTMRAYGAGIATSKITLAWDKTRLNTTGNLIHYLGLSHCRGLYMPRSCFDTVEYVAGASGASLAIERTLFDELGGFDESFFMYHDDLDLSLRALIAGDRCLYVPDSVVAHDYRAEFDATKWRLSEAYRYAVLLKLFRWRTLLLLLPGLVVLEVVLASYLVVRGPAFARAKLWSYGWLVRNLLPIAHARAQVQRHRRRSDREILAVLTDYLAFEQLELGSIGRLVATLLSTFFRIHRRALLKVVQW